jgi:hypothetical protein
VTGWEAGVDARAAERVARLLALVRVEAEAAHGALLEGMADGIGSLVVQRGARNRQRELELRLARMLDGDPAVAAAHRDVDAFDETGVACLSAGDTATGTGNGDETQGSSMFDDQQPGESALTR